MIIPGLFYHLFRRPALNLAWSVIAINLVIFFWTQLFFESWPSYTLNQDVKDKNFSTALVLMYKQTLDPIEYSEAAEAVTLTQALRDHRFWSRVSTFPFKGDVVQIELNRKRLLQFQREYFSSSQYLLGLGLIENSPWSWVTYQFTHVSLMHLFGNMLILFLLLTYLESSVGSFWLISVYLLGGFGGGISYLLFEGSGSMAVVGASASVFSLLAFILVIKRNESMPWSYIVAPVKNGYGVIYLPVFFIFPVFIMTEFITSLWETNGVSSAVAVSAHIGGTLTGLLLGLVYLFEQKLTLYLIRIWQIDQRKENLHSD